MLFFQSCTQTVGTAGVCLRCSWGSPGHPKPSAEALGEPAIPLSPYRARSPGQIHCGRRAGGFPCLGLHRCLLRCVIWERRFGWRVGERGGRPWGMRWTAATRDVTPRSSLGFLETPCLAAICSSGGFGSASPRALRAQSRSPGSFWQTCLSGCYIA